jgi:hypothetical protein
VLGGDQHRTDCQGNPFEIGNAHRQGGMGTAADLDSAISTVVFRSWPSS